MLRYRAADEQTAARVRALALLTLRHAEAITERYVDESLRDPDPDTRRVAAASLDLMPPALRTEFTRRAIGDRSLRVSVEAIGQLANHPRDILKCQWLNTALEETDIRPIRALALEALGEPCPDVSAQQRILMDAVSEIGVTNSTEWLAPARALVSLARIAPALAEAALPQFLEHENAFVRGYAATAAALIGQTGTLRALARDPAPNVRTAAIQFLAARDSELIDELLVNQLSTDDPQLLITAARLLENSPLGLQAASATLLAFERVSASQRETSRDARRALLERINEFGDATMTSRLEPFLRDFDPQVATDVANILERWSGQSRQPNPEPLPRSDLPNPDELDELRHSEVILHMQTGGEIVIQALPDVALTNAQRFVRLANEGYFDGLTFHRWEPDFVIQGGSPGANEYSGDGPYTRDEVALLPHWRGTVGLSTRGHDTGDAQIFINLVNNVRLNHDYTIFGLVVDGMEDVVDLVVEGDVITRAEVRVGT
jgi:cyclophilin family peptidyl-prolyl cis-trans isomerase